MTESKIDDYLLGRLNQQDLKEIESLLATDSAFAQTVKERQLLINVIDGFGDIEMKHQIQQVHQQEIARSKRINRRQWFYAAAAILLLVATSLWYLNQKTTTPSQIFANYYQTYPINFSTRNNLAQDPLLAKAESAYHTKDYENAFISFEAYASKNAANSKVTLALGICEIERNNNTKALQYFESLIQNDFDSYKDHAYWYAALILLQQNNLKKAKNYLQQIIKNNRPPFHLKAKEIIEKI